MISNQYAIINDHTVKADEFTKSSTKTSYSFYCPGCGKKLIWISEGGTKKPHKAYFKHAWGQGFRCDQSLYTIKLKEKLEKEGKLPPYPESMGQRSYSRYWPEFTSEERAYEILGKAWKCKSVYEQ